MEITLSFYDFWDIVINNADRKFGVATNRAQRNRLIKELRETDSRINKNDMDEVKFSIDDDTRDVVIYTKSKDGEEKEIVLEGIWCVA